MRAAWLDARAAWTGFTLDEASFTAHLARSRSPRESGFAGLSALRLGDLYLAAACARGDEAAHRAFDLHYGGALDRVFAKFERPGQSRGELRQLLWERLLLGRDGRPPKLAEYNATGELGGWVRVVATRLAIDERRRVEWELPLGDEALGRGVVGAGDPELGYLKERYQAQFDDAFLEAFGALGLHERNLLRQHYLDGLSLEALAALHSVHRATTARHLARARAQLFEATRSKLGEKLGVDESTLDSILRLLETRMGRGLRLASRG